MKKIILMKILFLSAIPFQLFSQMKINDKAIRHQQERMVYKQWSKNKFTPSTKVLGVQVNPMWYTVWGMHPNYVKKDHRPLGPVGPQTQRTTLTTQMKATEQTYQQESDSLRNIVLNECARNSILTPEPLWELYYKSEFKDLLHPDISKYLNGLTSEQFDFLVATDYWVSHINKMAELKERLEQGRSEMADRGARIIFYHRILKEYRQAINWWDSNKRNAPKYLAVKNKINDQKVAKPFHGWTPDTDKAIAEEVVRKFRYVN